MILNEVVDAREYVVQGWTSNLKETDRVMKSFYKYSFAAGPWFAMFDHADPETIEQSTTGF